MANYTVKDVQEIREFTGAGMMDVKKALDEADGNRDEAIKIIRIKGQKKVATRADRDAREGLVAVKVEGNNGFIIELNSETDFVAKSAKFIELGNTIIESVASSSASTVEEALNASSKDGDLKTTIENESAPLGEKIELKTVQKISGEKICSYTHKTAKDLPPSIAVLVAFDKIDDETGSAVAQHIAALSPKYSSINDVPKELIETEKEVALSKVDPSKPDNIKEKIAEGSLKKFYQEIVLLEQPLAKDPSITVGEAIKKAGAELKGFIRVRVGE